MSWLFFIYIDCKIHMKSLHDSLTRSLQFFVGNNIFFVMLNYNFLKTNYNFF